MIFATPLAEFQDDITALGEESVQRMALMLLASIREGKVRGHPLDKRAGTADLSDCEKIYFDPVGGDRPRFRLVYRIVDQHGRPAVQPVAVGRREDLDAYLRAARNLGRI